MYPPYADRYAGIDDGRYSSFPDRVGRARFGEREPDDFHRFARRDVGGPRLREEDWRSSAYMQRPELPYERPYESWKSERPTSWREEFQGNSWRRDGGPGPRHPEYDDWRRESSWRPRSPSPRGFGGPPRELIPGLAGPPRELIPELAGPPRGLIREPEGPPRELIPGLGGPRELIPGLSSARRRSPDSNGRARSPRNGGLSHRSEESVRRRPDAREGRSARRSPSSKKEEHLKNLTDEELEKAAILQMKLMAEQADDKVERDQKTSKREPDDRQTSKSASQNDVERKKKVKEKTERVNMPEIKVEEEGTSTLLTPKLEPVETFDENETAAEVKKPSQTKQENIAEAKEASKVKASEGPLVVKAGFEEVHLFARPVTQRETAAESRKSSQTKQEHIAEARETSKEKPVEGSLVVKAAFEDVHMFAKHKIYEAPSAAPSQGLDTSLSWYEQYLMSVNKRKQELQSGITVSPPLSQKPTSHGRLNGPRYPPQVPGMRTTSRAPSEMSSSTNSPLYLSSKDERALGSNTLIDPNQFIEELSDNEDWDSVGRVAPKFTTKRPAEAPIERPLKRGLLGAPPAPKTPPISHDPWQRPSVLTAKPVYSKPLPSVSFTQVPTEKSFFRMELPSVPPRIYFSSRLDESEEYDETETYLQSEDTKPFLKSEDRKPPVKSEVKSEESKSRVKSEDSKPPPQARIAPAAPLPHGEGHHTSWRHSERSSRVSALFGYEKFLF
ncbi:hypothetical protein Y032_0326g2570 [Ancylostoma ceylanicum]|uniref:Uncharacterized protein n=1 Tax=Ancylostoma ceylanicum TaxID=53326 RepID=A0A016S0T1_9BILA|nr:hypothetical protein Y032_0326g2570 [Ancylostoma ceylanicum]